MTLPLPQSLIGALRNLAEGVSEQRLASAYARLSQRYRAESGSRRLADADEAIAYALTRMPATCAVLGHVLDEALARLPTPKSLIDCGAGPGTASFALSERLPHLTPLLVEEHPAMRGLGEQLGVKARWQAGSFLSLSDEADWVLCSYALGELKEPDQAKAVDRLYAKAQQALILIEPGTPRGFEALRKARARLIALGARVAAPCPHDAACPLDSADWCHFTQRLPRLKAHKAAKAADVPYEDEPFAFVILVKPDVPLRRPLARILRPVTASKAGLSLPLCTPQGLETRLIPARDKAAHRAHRRLDWGDALDTETSP